LAGCHLRCFFCDTQFESSKWHPTLDELVEKIKQEAGENIRLVVLTGGEPLRQNIMPLVQKLNDNQMYCQIETAGSFYHNDIPQLFPMRGLRKDTLPWHGNTIVCSPKTPKINNSLHAYISGFKYIIRAGEIDETDGLPIKSTQKEGGDSRIARPWDFRSGCKVKTEHVYLQPMEEYKAIAMTGSESQRYDPDPVKTKANVDLCVELCLKFGYKLSLQCHKILGLR